MPSSANASSAIDHAALAPWPWQAWPTAQLLAPVMAPTMVPAKASAMAPAMALAMASPMAPQMAVPIWGMAWTNAQLLAPAMAPAMAPAIASPMVPAMASPMAPQMAALSSAFAPPYLLHMAVPPGVFAPPATTGCLPISDGRVASGMRASVIMGNVISQPALPSHISYIKYSSSYGILLDGWPLGPRRARTKVQCQPYWYCLNAQSLAPAMSMPIYTIENSRRARGAPVTAAGQMSIRKDDTSIGRRLYGYP